MYPVNKLSFIYMKYYHILNILIVLCIKWRILKLKVNKISKFPHCKRVDKIYGNHCNSAFNHIKTYKTAFSRLVFDTDNLRWKDNVRVNWIRVRLSMLLGTKVNSKMINMTQCKKGHLQTDQYILMSLTLGQIQCIYHVL